MPLMSPPAEHRTVWWSEGGVENGGWRVNVRLRLGALARRRWDEILEICVDHVMDVNIVCPLSWTMGCSTYPTRRSPTIGSHCSASLSFVQNADF